jgi:hypothetical protein
VAFARLGIGSPYLSGALVVGVAALLLATAAGASS